MISNSKAEWINKQDYKQGCFTVNWQMYFTTAFALWKRRKIHSLSGVLISNQPATCAADPLIEY